MNQEDDRKEVGTLTPLWHLDSGVIIFITGEKTMSKTKKLLMLLAESPEGDPEKYALEFKLPYRVKRGL